MKLKQNFTLRNICGEYVLTPEGTDNIDFTNILSINETAAFLWEKLKEKEFTTEDMANLLLSEYNTTQEQALTDCKELAQIWLDAKIAE